MSRRPTEEFEDTPSPQSMFAVGSQLSVLAQVPEQLTRPWLTSSRALEAIHRRMRARRRLTPENAYRLPFEALTLTTRDGLRLAAWYVPASRPQAAGVVLHHHFGAQKAYVLPWIRLFYDLGLACLAFDARGHGASDGERGLQSLVARGADARAAFEALKARGHRRIVGFGQSQGAAVVAMGLSGLRELAALVFDSGPSAELFSAVWGVTGLLVGDRESQRGLSRAVLCARLLCGAQPAGYVRHLWRSLWRCRDKPLAWLHGDADEVIPYAAVLPWFAALRPHGDTWRAVRIAGAAHVQTLQKGGALVEQAVRETLRRALERC